MRILIVGCGHVGTRLALRLQTQGAAPTGIVSSTTSVERLETAGIAAQRVDLDQPGAAEAVATAGAMVYYLAPPAVGAQDPRLAEFLGRCKRAQPRRIVYLSTSGVYGDCRGEWVDETRPTKPGTERARRRHQAEQALLAFTGATGVQVVILRVGGIYGPGRLPTQRLGSMTVICPSDAPYSNRIHTEDLVSTCLAAAVRGRPGAIYNVADGHPTTMTDYLYSVADAAGLPRPPCVPFADAEGKVSPAMLSFVREARRLDVTRMHDELGVQLQFPTLEEGLASCLL